MVLKSWQTGHWRSANSVIVTGALGLPSVIPDCGMPASSRVTSAAPAAPPTTLCFEPPPWLTAIAIATIAAATPSAPPSR